LGLFVGFTATYCINAELQYSFWKCDSQEERRSLSVQEAKELSRKKLLYVI
jgi:hypothetical protein